jgi:hypothetical protein
MISYVASPQETEELLRNHSVANGDNYPGYGIVRATARGNVPRVSPFRKGDHTPGESATDRIPPRRGAPKIATGFQPVELDGHIFPTDPDGVDQSQLTSCLNRWTPVGSRSIDGAPVSVG